MLFPSLFYLQTWLLVFKSLHLHPPFSPPLLSPPSLSSHSPQAVSPSLVDFSSSRPATGLPCLSLPSFPERPHWKLPIPGKAFQAPRTWLSLSFLPHPSSCPRGVSPVSPDLRLIPPHRLPLILPTANLSHFLVTPLQSHAPIRSLIKNKVLPHHLQSTHLGLPWWLSGLPMQGTWVQSLVREDFSCCRATKPAHHNY